MNEPESEAVASPPPRAWFQFSLGTLLLLFVLLATSLAVFGAIGIFVFIILGWLAIWAREPEWKTSLGCFVYGVVCVIFVACLMAPTATDQYPRMKDVQCKNNMLQILVALQAYKASHGSYPPPFIADSQGKPMHSWRTLILPYLDQAALYKSYNFNEPWDGPNNKKLLTQCPQAFVCPYELGAIGPAGGKTAATQTSYVAVLGPQATWQGSKPGAISLTHSIMVVEVADSGIAWSEPRDLSLANLETTNGKPPALTVSSKHRPRESFFFTYSGHSGANAIVDDGRVVSLPAESLTSKVLHKALAVDGYDDSEYRSGRLLSGGELSPNWPNIAAVFVWLVSVVVLFRQALRSRPRCSHIRVN